MGMRWDDLTFPQRFAVWSLRLWLAERQGDETACGRCEAAFAVAGAPEARHALDRLMRCVDDLPSRPVKLAPVNQPSLSDDEALLLRALTVAQAGGGVDGRLMLRPMFRPDVCRTVQRHCADYARALGSAGLDLAGAR
ncbi:MAG TPA: hypothetical protein VD860_11355 [Azospirillum sp.]|nr:hypothetical protein [Azospirillum sp.]